MEVAVHWVDRIGRRLKLRDLHFLMTVAQSGTMAKAAQQLAVSQPVVSKTISNLEHTLGVPLLDRTRLGVEPTMYGRVLLKHGAAIFDELRQSVEEIAFLADPAVGELRLGCPAVMFAGIVPVILNRLRRRHPRLTISLTQANSLAGLYRDLRDRNIELVLGRLAVPFIDEDLSAEILFNESLVVVAGTRNRWRRRQSIQLAELLHEPWVMPQDDVGGTAVAELFSACGLKVPNPIVVGGGIHLHRALLADGRSLATLPASVLQFGEKYASVKVLPVKLPDLPRPVGIVTLRDRMISPVAQLFIKSAREVAKTLAGQ